MNSLLNRLNEALNEGAMLVNKDKHEKMGDLPSVELPKINWDDLAEKMGKLHIQNKSGIVDRISRKVGMGAILSTSMDTGSLVDGKPAINLHAIYDKEDGNEYIKYFISYVDKDKMYPLSAIFEYQK